MATETRRTRAAPLSPQQRREAIIAATVPLIRDHGLGVSTRQIAAAAGIAEGTIFRVFDDKDSLLRQAVESAMHPGDTERRLAAIDAGLPLERRLLAAAEILRERLTSVFQLMTVLGPQYPPGGDDHDPPRHAETATLLEALIEPDRDQLRVPPAEAARRLRLLCFAGFHPLITDHRPLTPADVVDLLLHGVAVPPAAVGTDASDPSP